MTLRKRQPLFSTTSPRRKNANNATEDAGAKPKTQRANDFSPDLLKIYYDRLFPFTLQIYETRQTGQTDVQLAVVLFKCIVLRLTTRYLS